VFLIKSFVLELKFFSEQIVLKLQCFIAINKNLQNSKEKDGTKPTLRCISPRRTHFNLNYKNIWTVLDTGTFSTKFKNQENYSARI